MQRESGDLCCFEGLEKAPKLDPVNAVPLHRLISMQTVHPVKVIYMMGIDSVNHQYKLVQVLTLINIGLNKGLCIYTVHTKEP